MSCRLIRYAVKQLGIRNSSCFSFNTFYLFVRPISLNYSSIYSKCMFDFLFVKYTACISSTILISVIVNLMVIICGRIDTDLAERLVGFIKLIVNDKKPITLSQFVTVSLFYFKCSCALRLVRSTSLFCARLI